MLKTIAIYVLLALEVACFVGFTFVGILKEQGIREYKVQHLREYRQWLCDAMVNSYALQRNER